MKLLVLGSGMMGSAAAFDMARSAGVESVGLADADYARASNAAKRLNKLVGRKRIAPIQLDAGNQRAAARVMRDFDGVLSCVPYFYNVGLTKAAIQARCHFADLGGNNTVVRKTYSMSEDAARRGIALAPDCGLSPGMASILAGELMRRLVNVAGRRGISGRLADALKIYVGGLPAQPKPPFNYQLVFSVEGLINEYVEPARILRNGRIVEIEPLTEPEEFRVSGFPPLVGFHTSGGTSTLPETFRGKVGECFEKTLRYPGHFEMIRSLYDLGFFSSQKRRVEGCQVAPRQITSELFVEKFSGEEPDVVVMRVEAHRGRRILSFTLVDRFERATGMTAMMRTTAWPASVVLQMIARGEIVKRGGIFQELDVPGPQFLVEMHRRGVGLHYAEQL